MRKQRVMIALVFALAASFALTISAGAATDVLSPLIGDQVVFGGNVSVPAGETRDGDVVAFGGNVQIDGTVTQDVVAIGGNVVINGTVGRDVASVGGSVTLGPHASVGRDLAITGGSLTRDPGATVGRNVVHGRPDQWGRFAGGPFIFGPARTHYGGFGGASSVFGIVVAIGIILIGLMLVLFFPRHIQATGATVERRPLESLGLGCAGFLAGLALMVLFAITIIGIPVSFVIFTGLVVGWLFGWAALFLITGQRLLRTASRLPDLVPALLVGGVLLGVLANIPYVNVVVLGIGGSLALGAVIYSRFGTQPPTPRDVGPVVPPAATSPTT
jgi:hypothetical protein